MIDVVPQEVEQYRFRDQADKASAIVSLRLRRRPSRLETAAAIYLRWSSDAIEKPKVVLEAIDGGLVVLGRVHAGCSRRSRL